MRITKRFISQAIALMASSAVFAATDMETRVSQLEKQMKEVRTETAVGNYGALTASARVDVDGKGGFILLGPVYYFPSVGGTEFAYTDDDPADALPINGRLKEVSFDWDWGIRAAVGYNFDYDEWDIQLVYNWFSTSGSKHVAPGFNSVVVTNKGTPKLVENCAGNSSSSIFVFSNSGKAQVTYDFNGLDFELGRDFFVSKKLSLRSHFGLKTVWLDLQQISRYSGGTAVNEIAGLGINTVDVKDSSDFWGLGPRAGFDTRWFLGSGFSIYGNLAGSVMYGRFDVIHREKFHPCTLTNRIHINGDTHRFIPNGQFMLGLRYDRYFDDHHQAIAIRLGYDVQYFWRVQQMIKSEGSSRYTHYSEDASLHGVMADVRWSF